MRTHVNFRRFPLRHRDRLLLDPGVQIQRLHIHDQS